MINRREDIDAVAGLMIIWMVVGHLRQVCGLEWQSPAVLYFFMPWFYYKAGMMWKGGNVYRVANRGGQKLIKPFAIYAIIGQVVLTICMLVEGVAGLKPYLYSPIRSLVLGGCIGGNTPLWFIPSLLVVQILASWLLDKRKWPLLWAIISIMLGYGLYVLDLRLMPTYIESAFSGLFFVMLGYFLRDWQYKWWFIVVCVLCTVMVIVFGTPPFNVRENTAEGNYFVGAMASLVGCVAINGVVRWLQPYLKLYILQYVGRKAMTIYVTHWIVLLLSVRLIGVDILHIQSGTLLLWIGGVGCVVFILSYIMVLNYVKEKQNIN